VANDSALAVAEDVDVLFEPIQIAGVRVPNRIAMAPMTRGYSVGGVVAPTAVDYYRRRALGGTGLILTEGIATSDIAARTATVPHLTSGAAADAWRPVTAAVHEAGSVIMAQLWHTGLGRQRHEAADPTKLSIGPVRVFLPDDSPHAPGGLYEPGRAMDQVDIDAAIDEYATAAANAKETGFDGVELHAGHGYLIDQFFWAESNRRTDRYGGSIAHRSQFAVEIVEEIRRRVGVGFPVGLRFSQWKLPEHYTVKALTSPAELEQMLTPLVAAGVDFFDASTRRYWETEFGTQRTLAGWTKAVTGKPTIMVGSVGLTGPLDAAGRSRDAVAPDADLSAVIRLIATGEADLVAVGRAILSNPDWANKVRTGDLGNLTAFDISVLGRHW